MNMSEDPITGHYKENDVVTPGQLCVACVEFAQDFRKYLEEIMIEGISSIYSPSGDNHPPGTKAVWPKTFAFHHNLRSLKSSLEADCHLCTLLWLTMLSPQLLAEPATGFDWDRSLSIRVESRSYSSERRGQEFHLSLVEPGTEYALSSGFAVLDLNLGVQVVSKTSSEQWDQHIPAKEAFSVWTGSPTSLKLAKSWIKSCVTKHAACGAASSSHKNAGSRPTRLVDVSSGTEFVRVCSAPTEEVRTVDQQPRDRRSPIHVDYVTLSHAWGGAEFVKLTTQNYARLCDGFSIQELPKTWRDAICLTRSLGYRYIWIDALCIIQDSLCDWEVESGLMGQVYEHCHVNIAALGSTSSNDGLFRFRNPLMFKNCCLRDALGSSGWPKNHYLAMAVIRPPNYHGWDFEHLLHHAGDLDYIISLKNEPLNKRGWVIQERGLSPRTLYFGKAGLFWDCREKERQEMWADTLGWGPHFRDPEPTNSKKVFSWQLTYSDPTEQRVSLRYMGWRELIREYCAAELSFESDRLPAISGLARLIAANPDMKCAYYAGIWEKWQIDDLLWCIKEPVAYDTEAVDPNVHRAPISFSWASIGGPCRICWPFSEYQLTGKPKQILYSAQAVGRCVPFRPAAFMTADWKSDGQFGRIVSASFTVSCLICPLSQTEVEEWSERGRQGDLYKLKDHQKARRETGIKSFPDKEEGKHVATHRASLAHLDLIEPDQSYRHNEDFIVDFGLILSASGNGLQKNATYRRLGMYYDTFYEESYVKTRRGMYQHASVTLI